MSEAFKYDVFLSHSSKDKKVVREVAKRLKDDGLKVWFDEWMLKPGDSIHAKIEEGLEGSRVLVLCMSANMFGSDWVQLEDGTFRFRDPLNRERRFIPLRLDDACIKGSLAQFLYINWLPADREQEYPKLLEACRPPVKPTAEEKLGRAGPGKAEAPCSVGSPSLAAQQDLTRQLLLEYYGSDKLREVGLCPYTVDVEGKPFPTTLVTKREWIGCSVALDGKQDTYQLVDAPNTKRPDPESVKKRREMLEVRGLRVWDDSIYRLVSIALRSQRMETSVCLDKYLDYRFTNGGMQDEINTALAENEYSVPKILENRVACLPMRNDFMRCAQDVAAFTSRICAGGVNVMTAIARPNRDKDYAIILQRRSANVGSRQGALTTIPSGLHQHSVRASEELSIRDTVCRELFEELFDGSEVEQDDRHLIPGWYKKTPKGTPVAWLDIPAHTEKYTMCLTGFGYSLLTGSCTFSVLLAIHDEQYWTEYFSFLLRNWEADREGIYVIGSKGRELHKIIKDPLWTDYGFFSFVEGIRQLKKIDPNRVDIPNISLPPDLTTCAVATQSVFGQMP